MTTQHSNIGLSSPELVVSVQEGSGAPTWPRVRNLPPEEQYPFALWLQANALQRPIIEDEPDRDQDGYYTGDYRDWNRRKELEPLPPKENGKAGLFDRIAFPNGEQGQVLRSAGNCNLMWQGLVPQ